MNTAADYVEALDSIREMSWDRDGLHEMADTLLCEALVAAGWGEVAAAWRELRDAAGWFA